MFKKFFLLVIFLVIFSNFVFSQKNNKKYIYIQTNYYNENCLNSDFQTLISFKKNKNFAKIKILTDTFNLDYKKNFSLKKIDDKFDKYLVETKFINYNAASIKDLSNKLVKKNDSSFFCCKMFFIIYKSAFWKY